MLLRTGLNNVVLLTLLKVVNNGETTLLHAIQPQQYCSMLLTAINNVGSTTLFNPVELQAHDFLPCILTISGMLLDVNCHIHIYI